MMILDDGQKDGQVVPIEVKSGNTKATSLNSLIKKNKEITYGYKFIDGIGIPVGLQCFKLSSLSLNPFGKDTVGDGSAVSFILNIIWVFLSGLELALINLILGILLCITIIGIPFGKQFFKIAKLSLAPFGRRVVKV